MSNHYILGKGKTPEWCRQYITPYRKNNGSIGYEFHAKHTDFYLKKGDKLIKKDKTILVEVVK